MVESIYCPPETQNIVNQLYSNTKYSLLIMYGLWGCRRTSILCRENKEQESEGKKQGERRTMDILFLIIFHVVYDWVVNIFPYAIQ